MKASFLHLGDVHLGHEQYGKKERADDFARAFYYAVDYAVEHRVDFVVVAGDLFERSTLDPVTFDQALYGLEDLRRARIPIVDIAGNHDRARYGQGRAWVESLGLHGFLHYLDAVGPEGMQLRPWSAEEGSGGYLDLKGIRFVGMRYLGASTARAVEELGAQLQGLSPSERPYTVALLHAGLDGVVPNFRAELTYEQLAPLRGLVDYVALGHIHQHYSREAWVYNPGSLETWNVGEVAWERGFLHVEVDDSVEPRHTVRLVVPPRRAFLRYRLEVEPCTSPEDLMELLRRHLDRWTRESQDESPVVHLTLSGRLRFDRHDLELGALEAEVVSAFRPLVVQIRDQTDETAFQVRAGEEEGTLDRSALELEVLRQLFANDERRVHRASAWARLAQSLKLGAISRESPEQLAELVRKEMDELSS
ncbi:MAG: metallophosphoesterase family protein [Chloroflexota bacterium]